MALTFKGGVHPLGKKELAANKAIVSLQAGSEMVYPVSQHIGAPANPIVKKGDRVLVGQLIAEASGFVSANIHSSVSGTVKNIETRKVSNGNVVNSIVIENDGLYEAVDFASKVKPLDEMNDKEIIDAVFAAGIVGLGGATFPTHVKLSVKEPDTIDTVIVNGAECEPYLDSDYRRMLENGDKVVKGLDIVLRLFKKARGVIAIEDNKPEAIKLMKEACKGYDRIEVLTVKTKYPQGGERFLIYAVTKREINYQMLPSDAHCVVQNIDTMRAIYEAIYEGKPLMRRLVTLTGDAIASPQVYDVPIGMNLKEVLDIAGGYKVEPKKFICGGPMMGTAMTDADIPVAKGVSSLLALSEDEISYDEDPCIKCGRCAEACPSRIQPFKLAEYARKGMMQEFIDNDGLECCECGCCSYICPAKRPLTHRMRNMKKRSMAAIKNNTIRRKG